MLHREMGLNLSNEITPFSLGIRARKAELVLPPILLHDWDFRTSLCTSFFTIFQQTLMNLAMKSSGTGLC